MASFYKDNAVSNRFEIETIIIPFKDGTLDYAFKWNDIKKPEFDVEVNYMDKTSEKIEVKAQQIYKPVDDIRIEFKGKGQPKGIELTTSDYYFVYKYHLLDKPLLEDIFYTKTEDPSLQDDIHYTLYVIETSYLKKIIKENKFEIDGKDDSNTGKLESGSYKIPLSFFTKKDVDVIKGKLNYDDFKNLQENHKIKVTKSKIYYDHLDKTQVTYGKPQGAGRYDSDSSSSSSSSSDEGTCRKVFNRLKRNINKKYKIKKEKYL